MSTGERRVCLFAGAAGTLGSAFCAAYAADYDIVAVCRRRAPAVPSQHESFVDPLDVTATLPDNAHRVHVVYADLEQPGQIERVVDVALALHGRVDLLVNNAAYSRWHAPGLLDSAGTMVDFQRHFSANVAVPMLLASRLAGESWAQQAAQNRDANRNVVNVSSIAASRVYPGGQAVYAASKAALNQLTRHLAREFDAFGVRVNAVAPNSFPSIVATDQVAAAVVRLDAEQVTGKILGVDSSAGPPTG